MSSCRGAVYSSEAFGERYAILILFEDTCFLAGVGVVFFGVPPFLTEQQSTTETPPPANTKTPMAEAPMMIPRFELEAAGAGVVSGDGGGAGGAAVVSDGAAVLAGCAAVVILDCAAVVITDCAAVLERLLLLLLLLLGPLLVLLTGVLAGTMA